MPTLNVPQAAFLAMRQQYKAYVAGYGSGKTWVGCADLCKFSLEHPGINAGYFAPTYSQIKDIFYPTIEEVADDWGLRAVVKTSNREVDIYSGRHYRNTIICRSMDKPSTIVGFKIGRALVDELDVMAKVKAGDAWKKIIARMRVKAEGVRNGVAVTTTPEGFKFVYDQFVKAVRDDPRLKSLYGLIQASTYDNAANLPADYILSLYRSYPKQLIDAYLRGMFTNLTSGSVYANFDRKANHTDAVLLPDEPIHVGLDFNVLNMTAVLFVIRGGQPLAIGELTQVRDTPQMAQMLRQRYKDKGHTVRIYPDASGQNTSSKSASESDLSILRQQQLMVVGITSNPAVKDRVNAVNASILNGEGNRRFKVNTDACPVLTEALEQQAYDKNGEPDKATGHDHPNDAAGYFIVNRFPIAKYTLSNVGKQGGKKPIPRRAFIT